MKTLLVILICTLYSEMSLAQKDSLSFDERNKYIYYQVVNEPELTTDTLYTRALYFMKKAFPKSKLKLVSADKNEDKLTGRGVILVAKKTLVINHEDGEIRYSFNIEVKEGKYRYWLTDFIYTPYQRNRYGVFEPIAGIDIPLEDTRKKIDPMDLKYYLDKITLNSRAIAASLKTYMENVPIKLQKEIKTKSIVTKDW